MGLSCELNVYPTMYLGAEEKLGRIQFSLGYDSRDMVLTLKVMRAAELAAKDFSGTSDPYVKIMLLPDKKNKLQTNVKRKNLNPRWNETFAFEGAVLLLARRLHCTAHIVIPILARPPSLLVQVSTYI